MALAIAASGTLALAAIYWRFNDLIGAFTSDISTADPGRLALLREDNLLEHRHYRMALTVVTVVMIAALWHLWVLWRRERPGDGRPALLAAGAVLTLAVLMLDVPYRILYQVDRFQVVRFDGQSCYALAETAAELLVFCPLTATPRNRSVRPTDPRLVRLDCYGRVFEPPGRCEPR